MDVKTTARYLDTDDNFTDEMGHMHQVATITRPHVRGLYVYVVGQSYPEFYLNDHVMTIHVPDTKFKPGDWVVARSGKGSVYLVSRVIPGNRYSGMRYVFDNGSVHVAKRARSGYHDVEKANRGYKLVKD